MRVSRSNHTSGFTPLLGAVLLVAIAFLLVTAIMTVVNTTSPSTSNLTDVSVSETPGNSENHRNVTVTMLSTDEIDTVLLQSESDTMYFERAFDSRNKTGVKFRQSSDCAVSDCIEWAEADGATDGMLRYGLTAPENDGTVSVTVNLSAVNHTHSGMEIYAVTESGNRIQLACDGETEDTLSPPTDFESTSANCLDRGANYTVNFTRTISANGSITGVYIASDIKTTDGTWGSKVRFSSLSITNTQTNETRRVCIPCHVPQETTKSEIDSDASETPSTARSDDMTLSGLSEGERVSIIAVRNGRETVVKTHVVGD